MLFIICVGCYCCVQCVMTGYASTAAFSLCLHMQSAQFASSGRPPFLDILGQTSLPRHLFVGMGYTTQWCAGHGRSIGLSVFHNVYKTTVEVLLPQIRPPTAST